MDKKSRTKDAATTADAPSQDAKRTPEKTFRIEDCMASLWPRTVMVQGKPRVYRSVTIQRSYKDRTGVWQYTKSFDLDSPGKLVALCQQVDEYVKSLPDAEQDAQ